MIDSAVEEKVKLFNHGNRVGKNQLIPDNVVFRGDRAKLSSIIIY